VVAIAVEKRIYLLVPVRQNNWETTYVKLSELSIFGPRRETRERREFEVGASW